jgi:pimeloyl-ACP methyl ester carboxylesterase|tara:strand:+ start:31 stop:1017 length:987 start_codon:yes stop_codon:yes gene_type:complete
MSLPEWISSNESLLSGIAAVVVIFGFIAAISRPFLKKMWRNGEKSNSTQKITLSELSSPSPYPIQFADSDGVKLAFNSFGLNEPTLIVTPGIISNLHVSSHLPPIKETMRALAQFSKVINFDKRGQGLSDPTSEAATMKERVKDIACIADKTNTDKFFLMGISEGGPMSIKYAIENPARVSGLILFGTTAKFSRSEDYPMGISNRSFENLIQAWGTGSSREIFFPSISRDTIDDDAYKGFEKLLSDRRSMSQIVAYMKTLDVRPILNKIQCPTLVIHFTGDLAVPVRMGRYLADNIPNSKFIEIAGVDHCDLGNAPEAIFEIKKMLNS